ncbi:hypothetical protein Ate01nite_21130 [Actinoplanes teichomyceticus]|nr:hypothetical protein Ate01nite_21130 [Actinoplanes teichomyceticus]
MTGGTATGAGEGSGDWGHCQAASAITALTTPATIEATATTSRRLRLSPGAGVSSGGGVVLTVVPPAG